MKAVTSMDEIEAKKKKRSRMIAYALGGIAFVWYIASMFTIWH